MTSCGNCTVLTVRIFTVGHHVILSRVQLQQRLDPPTVQIHTAAFYIYPFYNQVNVVFGNIEYILCHKQSLSLRCCFVIKIKFKKPVIDH